MSFGGTLEKSDIPRLNGQLRYVYEIMADGKYRTLREIVDTLKSRFNMTVMTQSAAGRLRDLRREVFGGFQVNKRNLGEGLFEYQVLRADGTVIQCGVS